MTAGLIILEGLTILGAGLLVWRVLSAAARERQEHRREVQVLCQRIQAPEVAVAQAASSGAVDLPAVNLEVDEDYWSAQEDALNRIAAIEAGNG